MKSSYSYFTEKYWEGISIGIWIVALIVWAIFAPTIKEIGAAWLILYTLLFIIASLAYFVIASRHD
jgi:hypothetical protein